MASSFNLTAELNLRGPSNLNQVVGNIRKQLSTVSLDLKIDPRASSNIQGITSNINNLSRALRDAESNAASLNSTLRTLGAGIGSASTNIGNLGNNLNNANNAINNVRTRTAEATSEIEAFGRQAGLAVRRFAAFSIVTGSIYAIAKAFGSAYSEFLNFNKEFIRLQQVTAETATGLKGLSQEIVRLSQGLGVTSQSLLQVSVTLSQAGLSAAETKTALEALAKSSLAPSFDDMNSTVEGSIALMKQFGISANDLESALGSINAVAAKFAVEASDIITAIQRTGGVFASASQGVSQGKDALNEFIAVFTSVRATTRESAETIATGLRTIFSRIQRGGTIEALKQYGVELTDVEGKFVGAYEAVRRLSDGLSKLDTRDIRFSAIIEELGGFRQVGKVIPLIQQFATAQEALNVAQRGAGSLAKDVATAQEGLGVKITKVREQFVSLVRDVGQSKGFQTFVDISLKLASALISIADAAKSVLPALTAIIAVKGISNIGSFVTGLSSSLGGGGGRRRFARGGLVPGSGSGDTVPAMLTPGEFVIRKKAVETIGINNLHKMNKYAGGGPVSPQKLYSTKMKKYVEENLDSIDTINFNKTIYGLQSSKNVTSNTFEELVKNKLGRGTHKGGNYPVDIIGTGKGPVEVRNRLERTPDFVLADKLMRYYLEDGQTDYIKRFTKKKNQKADSIQLGNIGIAYNLAKYKPLEKYTKLAGGGSVDDTVPALLTPGEFVINKKAAQRIGHHKLNRLNNADKIRGYNKGGSVGFVQSYAAGGGASIFDSLTSSINKVIQSFKQLTDTNTLQRARQLKAQGYDRAERRDIIGQEKAAKATALSPTSLLLGAGVAGDLLSKAGAPALGAAVAGGAGAAGVTKTVVDSLAFLPPQLKLVAVSLAAVAGAASAYLASLREISIASAQKSIETFSNNLNQAFDRLSKTINTTSDSFGEIRTTIESLRNAGQVISQAKTEEFVPAATTEGLVYSAIGTVIEAAMLNLVDTGIGKMDKREELSYSKELESAARPAAEATQKAMSEALKRGLTFDQARTAVGATDRDIAIAKGGSAITDLEARLAAVQSDRTLPETVRNKKEAEIKQAIALTTSRLVESYRAEVTAKQENIAITRQLIESSNQYSQSLQNTIASVLRASSEFSQYVQDINAAVGTKGGDQFQPSANKIDTDIFKNLRAYSQAEVSSAIDNLASRLNFSPEFTQQTKERVSVKQNLEKGIQNIFGSLSVKSGTGEDVSGEFDKAIRGLLAPLKLSVTSLGPILDNLRKEFNALSGSGADVTLSELAKNNPGLQKFFDTVGISSSELDKMSEAANQVAAEVTRFGSKLTQSLVLAQEYSNAAVSARTEGSLRLSQTLNEPVALDQLNQSFNNAIRSLTRVTFAGDNRRGGPQVFESYGGTTDVATIEARLRQTEEEQKTLDQNKNRTAQEEVRFAQVNAQATNLEKALKQLATDSSRASNALSKIEEVQKAKQGRTDVLMDLLSNVNNPEYMTDFIMNQQKFSNIMAGQGNSFDIPGAIQALQIKMRGQTADDALKTRGDFLEQIFQMLPADLANAVKQTLEAPEYNVSDFIKEYNDAIKAMAAANEALASRSLEAAGIFETAIKGSANYFADKVTKAADNTTTTGSATATTKANGGLIYAARGKYVNFQPKGTDTVPAMLTPGEFVVNAKATKKNLSLLKAINSNGKAAGYSMGGMVYLQGGGLVEAAKARLDEINAQIAEYANQTRLYIQEWTDSVIEDPKDQAALDRQKVGIEKINQDRSLTNEYTELLRRKTEAQEALNYEQNKVDLKTRMETDTNERIKNIPRNEGESDADYKARATKQLKEDDDRDQKRIEAYEERQKNARLQEQQRRADAVAAEQVRLNNRTPKERLEDERRARKEAAEQERAARVATNISRLPEAARRDAERKRAEEQRALANKAMGLSGSEDSAQTIEAAQNWWVRGGFMDNPGVGFTADLKTIIERYKASEQYQKDKAVSIESKQEGLRDFQRASEPSADYKAKLEERREASSQKEAQDRERTQKNQKTTAEKSQLDSGRVYFNQMYTSSGTRYSNASTDDILTDLESNRGRPQGYYNLKPEQQAYLDAYIGEYQFRQRSAKNAAEAQALEQKRATKLEAEKAEITLRTRGTPEEQAARNKQIADAEAARLEREQKYGLRSIDYQFLTESQMEEQKRAGRGPGTPLPFVPFNEFLVERGKTDQAAREKAAQNAAPITEEQKRKEEFNLLSPIEQIEYNRKKREDAFSPERAVTRALQRKVTELDPSGSENLLELAKAEMENFFMPPRFEDQASLDASVADIIARARQNAAQRGATTTNRIAASNEERKRRNKEAGFDREIETVNGQFNPYFDTDVANKEMRDTLSKLPIVRDVIKGSRNSRRVNFSDLLKEEVATRSTSNVPEKVGPIPLRGIAKFGVNALLDTLSPENFIPGAGAASTVARGAGRSRRVGNVLLQPPPILRTPSGVTVSGSVAQAPAQLPFEGFGNTIENILGGRKPGFGGNVASTSPTGGLGVSTTATRDFNPNYFPPRPQGTVLSPPVKPPPPVRSSPQVSVPSRQGFDTETGLPVEITPTGQVRQIEAAKRAAEEANLAQRSVGFPEEAPSVGREAEALGRQYDRAAVDADLREQMSQFDSGLAAGRREELARIAEEYNAAQTPTTSTNPFATMGLGEKAARLAASAVNPPAAPAVTAPLRSRLLKLGVSGAAAVGGIRYAGGQLSEEYQKYLDKQEYEENIKAIEEYRKRKGALNATTRANGGLIYASRGKLVPYQPRGTDTVPAMLTPGEFVINRKAAKQNMGLLKAINNGQTITPKRFNKGGIVDTQYYETAGPVASPTTSGGVSNISVDTSSLDTAFSNFQTYVGSFGGFVGAFNEAASKLGGLSDVASSLSQIDLTTSAGSLNLAAVSIKDASSILQGQIGPFSSSVTELAGVISRIPSTITLTAQGSIPVNGTITVTLEGPGAGNLDETNAENIQKSVFDKIALAINQATAGSLNIVQT